MKNDKTYIFDELLGKIRRSCYHWLFERLMLSNFE